MNLTEYKTFFKIGLGILTGLEPNTQRIVYIFKSVVLPRLLPKFISVLHFCGTSRLLTVPLKLVDISSEAALTNQ